MRKKSEMQKANEEFVKTYDDSKYPKPSVTADIVIFGMFDKEEDYYRNLLGGLYRENPVKSRNYEAVKSSKKWENVGNSYIIPALLLYRYSYI